MATPLVGIVMGSDSDWPTMNPAAEALDEFGIAYEACRPRAPDARRAVRYGREGHTLAGCAASSRVPAARLTCPACSPRSLRPAIGVPVPLKYLDGMDSLLSIVQMPAGVPVATVAIGGARNAGLLAVRILGVSDPGPHR